MNVHRILKTLGLALLPLFLGGCGLFTTLSGVFTGVTGSSSGASSATSSRPTTVRIGDLAPEINLKSLTGDRIVLSELVGHPVLVNFWATWCGPCREEFPALVRKYKQYKDQGLIVIGVNYQDDNTDEGVLTFMRNTNVNFPIVRDVGERVGRMYRINGLPTSFFIDTKGIVRDIVVGGPMTDDFIDGQVAKLK